MRILVMSIEISCNTANYYNDVGLKNLEAEFASLAFSDVNIQKCDFADYLSLNEGMPEQMGEHLELMEEGVVVFTGGERGFFTVLFSKEEKFQGGIGRDINYKVKCYGDFNPDFGDIFLNHLRTNAPIFNSGTTPS
jgi:hypothetical protein